jgi:alpha-N-arabinofuranosidase
MNAHNTFEKPDVVKPAAFQGFELKDGTITATLPAKSVVVLEIR